MIARPGAGRARTAFCPGRRAEPNPPARRSPPHRRTRMIKALLTPVILGLAVAAIIRLATAERA